MGGEGFRGIEDLGYTTKTAERDIVKNPKIHNLILQIKGVCLRSYARTSRITSVAPWHRLPVMVAILTLNGFVLPWLRRSYFMRTFQDGCTVYNQGRYLEDVTVTVKPDAFQEALPGLEASLLRLCNPETIWESPECFRIIDGYIRCPTVPKTYITTRISDILSEYAALTIFMDLLLRPFKAPSIQELYRKSPVSPPSVPRRPGWDPSWTGMKYGGDPIHMLNFIPHMTKKLLSVEERDWLPKLWGAIDDAYLTNTSKSINDYWEVEVIVERPPQWHDNRDKTSSGIYVAPPVALLSERAVDSFLPQLKLFSPEYRQTEISWIYDGRCPT
ncbi:hypothetical protein B0H14DRAFT_3491066 [Mycena olivaceomarginata]|nr:hypothetical protein B0H14DRAFT_3491066 [Mycena olivaceomarginata]